MIDEERGRESIKEEEIRIDYENIDVADIMEQIKRKIAKKPKKPLEEIQKGGLRFTPSGRFPLEPGEVPGVKNKIRRVLLKVMKPFSPVIKLLILPVYEEFREAFLILDRTNRRIDFLSATLEQELAKISIELEKFGTELAKLNTAIGNVERRVDDVNQNLNQRVDDVSKTLNKRLNHTLDDLGKTMEYTKILHSLTHNIVVELSKLKIEEENLKLMTRIMKKDFEFLRRRERSLEKNIFR